VSSRSSAVGTPPLHRIDETSNSQHDLVKCVSLMRAALLYPSNWESHPPFDRWYFLPFCFRWKIASLANKSSRTNRVDFDRAVLADVNVIHLGTELGGRSPFRPTAPRIHDHAHRRCLAKGGQPFNTAFLAIVSKSRGCLGSEKGAKQSSSTIDWFPPSLRLR
jgi:hypothetical protein